ncbi:MAG: TraB/GumN family protein [Alphaproteobacteria bacterium]|nr:TraB/GumN family protein [Alphaproteobacteria bacterium]
MRRQCITRKVAVVPITFACALFVHIAAAMGAKAEIDSGPAIWRVRSGESTVYLFGSIHILPNRYPWITRRIADAMNASDLFVFEVPLGKDTTAQDRAFVLKYGVLPRRQSIRGLLTPSQFELYATVMQAAGLNARDYERYRPWLAALVLGLAYLHPDDLTALTGADNEVMNFAREHDRPSQYLETPVQQLELLTSGSDDSQIAELRHLIDTLPSTRDFASELLEAWSAGDIERLTVDLNGVFRISPETEDLLVTRRNRLWLSMIDPLLQRPGTAMITVGAAHIGGSSGLIALICGEGHRVERLLDTGKDVDACPMASAP